MNWIKNNIWDIAWAIFLLFAFSGLLYSLSKVYSTTEFTKIQADNAVIMTSVITDMSDKLDSMQRQIDSLNVFVQNPK
jgi:hypothetical protein